jgi:transcriptional regulator
MYIPSSFNVADLLRLHTFIQQHSFGLLITQDDGVPFASHLPFLLERDSSTNGTLVGHIAKANPQWKAGDTNNALAIFSGPHTYVSPSWYEAPEVVPTWNYIAVHAYGRLTWIEDADPLRQIVESSVTVYERSQPQPWQLDASADLMDKLLKQIVGFRLEITRLEGKWKLNQNHPVERREKVIRRLQSREDENSQAIAAAMEESLRSS